jgi:FAD/FMN-containing dehydrogenase
MGDLGVTTITGADTVLERAVVEDFKASIRGELLRPGDDGYDAARKVYNAMIDKRPALIVRCASTADVINVASFARTHDLLVSIRAGGHNVAGKAVCDGGVLIDLSSMKGIRVDPAHRTARAQPGLRLSEFDRETQAFGLATPLGVISNTGIAGLTLGGGLGWLNGKYGLACDNLLSVDVVTADGQLLTASPSEHADLFWGVRGGGGNFGIVTSFEYRLHPVGPVLGGMMLYDMRKAKEVLRFFRDFSWGCPDELSTQAAFLTGLDGILMLAIIVCYCGAVAEGEKVLEPLRTFGSPVADLIRSIEYVEMQRLFDESFPPGRLHYWKTNFVRAVSDNAIEMMVEYATTMPSPLSAVLLYQMHGMASRVSSTDTAFAHRYEQYNFEIISNWTDPADSEKNIEWTRAFWGAMQPLVEPRVSVNHLGEEGEERVRAAYGPNYERLAALKNEYDPTNFFRLNHNIKPTVH